MIVTRKIACIQESDYILHEPINNDYIIFEIKESKQLSSKPQTLQTVTLFIIIGF